MPEGVKEKNVLTKQIVNTIEDAKGKEIVTLDLRNIETSICDFFIVCTGTSNTHVKSIEDKIKKMISKKLGEKPINVEGSLTAEWILMDYYNVVIHIFQKQTREFYKIEDFWGDAEITIH
tara:strand:+ start:4774 stop:5133 length:360 start_codon:yes stop_codon:yes gene_type:complete